jgi:CRISPR-associated protein (TIGR02710 family)
MTTTVPLSTMLICTVGGTPEPIVEALKKWRPVRIRFVHTPGTKGMVAEIIPKARAKGVDLDAGRYDLLELPDEQDFTSCVERLRGLTDEVQAWAERGDGYWVVVDFTGGTKCMTAALAVHASHWPRCRFSYVGGKARTKDGVGVVISGSETVRDAQNPRDALGQQAVDDFIVLFDRHAYLAAANVAVTAMRRVSFPSRKRELASLEQLARALDAWDGFDHGASKNLLENVSKSANDVRAALGSTRGDRVLDSIRRLAKHFEQVVSARPPSLHHVIDLLANARRRKEAGRIDDAARLYRAIEAIAQLALKERHNIESTEKVPLERVPESLRSLWMARSNDGVVALGLQDAYALLTALRDPVGKKFQDMGLSGATSPLVARNRSILAHGFECVSDTVFDKLWSSALALADIDEAKLPFFPALTESRA